MNRQTERRKFFVDAFSKMPLWETWETKDYDVPPKTVVTSMYQAGMDAVTTKVEVEPPKVRHHVKLIPRRVRRSMARDLAKRGWQATRYSR